MEIHGGTGGMTTELELTGSGETIGLQQQVARLQALLEASRHVHSTVSEEEVLRVVLRIVVRELEMAGAAFRQEGMSYGEVPETPGDVADQALPIYLLADREGRRLTELMVNPPEGRPLSLYEADFLEGLALQAAVALENARNHERNLHFARVQQDMDAARNIQRSLLPHKLPEIKGYSVGFRSDTCYEVGGDYLDIVEQPDGQLLMVVADVAGKGLASAMMSTIFRSTFRALAAGGLPLAELATRMNELHWAEGEEARRRYVTAIFLRLQPDTGALEVTNAGHNPGFLVSANKSVRMFESTGTPLGMLPGMQYGSETAVLEPDSRLLFYTDGLTEVFRGEEEFGEERLLDVFSKCPSQKADDILDALWAELTEYAAGGAQSDDMTALSLSRSGVEWEI
ncbi:MAG TPA: PP2C family protein-serine/threonine phosphatase [Bryobacteraceae bacterium]|nr:PP2C family protein-serine/threonine phosphatase [Bryobacteraceae bacterium]